MCHFFQLIHFHLKLVLAMITCHHIVLKVVSLKVFSVSTVQSKLVINYYVMCPVYMDLSKHRNWNWKYYIFMKSVILQSFIWTKKIVLWFKHNGLAPPTVYVHVVQFPIIVYPTRDRDLRADGSSALIKISAPHELHFSADFQDPYILVKIFNL